MDVSDILERCDSVKPRGLNTWIARCPAHADKTPSLSVSKGEGDRILFHCHAGCDVEAIVESMGLMMSDLHPTGGERPLSISFNNSNQASKKPALSDPITTAVIEKLHHQLDGQQRDYLRTERMLTDEVIDRYRLGFEERGSSRRLTIPIADEESIYRDIRCWLPPEARQANDSKMMHWKSGYGAARLFPLDQLQSAELILCEGELDALALISHGIAAITATCGASTWPDALSGAFAGKSVTILLDNDEAGQKGALKRAESLSAHGVKVRIAQWPK